MNIGTQNVQMETKNSIKKGHKITSRTNYQHIGTKITIMTHKLHKGDREDHETTMKATILKQYDQKDTKAA